MKDDLLVLVNEKIVDAELLFAAATPETIVEVCKEYLAKLGEYRERLYELHGTKELGAPHTSAVVRALVLQVRKAILTALQNNVRDTNEIESLLKSFTLISGYEVADVFNQFEYKGSRNWELRPGGLRLVGQPDNDAIPLEVAVETASMLRRKAYVAGKEDAKLARQVAA
jgi:hypothetical protein